MVGVPRSMGCALCRKRRVKCDEERPACANCRKYGVECPGYDRGLKFVAGKHRIRQKGRHPGIDAQPSDPSGLGATTVVSDAVLAATALVRPPLPNKPQYMSTIVEQIRSAVFHHDVVGLFAWIRLDKLGQKTLLDGATCSLALHLFGKEYVEKDMLVYGRTIYRQSLRALQAALRHPTEWRSSETLCSAILLCIYELFEGTAAETWLQHAKGIGTLMEKRGPAAHAHGWDAAMILSFRGILIMADMFHSSGDDCFLARPEWRPIIRDGGRHLAHPPGVDKAVISVMDGFFDNLAGIPAVLKLGYRLREANMLGDSINSVESAELSNHAAGKHRKFSQWAEELQAVLLGPKEVPSEDPNSLYTSVLAYGTPWAGAMHMAYWASMLILEETLAQCRWPGNFDESKTQLVRNILRSVETVGKGRLGPYRLGYPLRIAYEFASAEAQQWLRNLLDVFSRSYAATNKESYPNPRIDRGGYA